MSRCSIRTSAGHSFEDLSSGRFAIAIANHPDIFPINYVVDHGTVVFRTAEGTKLAGAVLGTGVAFEVDGLDTQAKRGMERGREGSGD